MNFNEFISNIQIDKTHIIGRLPIIWVFGSCEDIAEISQNNHPKNPYSSNFNLFKETCSFRGRFIQWLKSNNTNSEHKELIFQEYDLNIPEDYPEWSNRLRPSYTNLVDFELDIISISQLAIIFSESIGTYVEIGALSCHPLIHQNLLIISPPEYISADNSSFFNYGAIHKIKSNQISEELTNIWALPNNWKEWHYNPTSNTEDIAKHFMEITEHCVDILTGNNKKQPLNIEAREHVFLLIVDLLDLFPEQTLLGIQKLLVPFKSRYEKKELEIIINCLTMLKIIQSKQIGKNTLFSLHDKFRYKSCIDYTGTNAKKFDRVDFKLDLKRTKAKSIIRK